MNVLRTSLIGAATVACLAGVASGGPEFTYISANRGVSALNIWPPGTERERVEQSRQDFSAFDARVEVTDSLYGAAFAEQHSSMASQTMQLSTSLYGGGGFGHATYGQAGSFFDVFFEVSEPAPNFHIFGMRGGDPYFAPFPFESWIRLIDTRTNTTLASIFEGVGQYVFAQAALEPGVRYRLLATSECSGVTYWNDGWGQSVETSWREDALALQVVVPSGPTGLVMVGGLLAIGGRRRTR